MRLALRGLVDFSKARLQEVGWWRRVNTLIRGMLADDDKEMVKAAYAFQCALVANGNLSEESFKKAQTDAKDSCMELFNIIQPWASKTAARTQKEKIESLIDIYKRTVGDPKDPKFATKLRQSLAADKAKRGTRAESDQARVSRLFAEQAKAKSRRKR